MNERIRSLKDQADKARILYKKNIISRDEAYLEIMPYIVTYNETAKRIAKKHNVRPGTINFASYIR